MDQIKIGRFIAQMRRTQDMTQRQLADMLSISDKTVSKWESGESYPDIEKCVKLSRLYNVSLDALVNKPIQELVREGADRNRYVFGVTKLNGDRMIKLPERAVELFEIGENDILLVVGDKEQGMAIVKCGGINDFIDKE